VNRVEIFKKISKAINKSSLLGNNTITEELTINEICIDSLGKVIFANELEIEFDIYIENEDFDKFKKVSDIIDFIDKCF